MEVEGSAWSASSSLLLAGFVFPAALTPIRTCDRSRSSNLINAIFLEEELEGAAQSKPTHASGHSEQVRHRAAPTFQSGFLFPFKRVLLSVPFELVLDC